MPILYHLQPILVKYVMQQKKDLKQPRATRSNASDIPIIFSDNL